MSSGFSLQIMQIVLQTLSISPLWERGLLEQKHSWTSVHELMGGLNILKLTPPFQ